MTAGTLSLKGAQGLAIESMKLSMLPRAPTLETWGGSCAFWYGPLGGLLLYFDEYSKISASGFRAGLLDFGGEPLELCPASRTGRSFAKTFPSPPPRNELN